MTIAKKRIVSASMAILMIFSLCPNLVRASTETLELDSIEVKTNPTKISYDAGEKFDPTGLVLNLNYLQEVEDDTEDAPEVETEPEEDTEDDTESEAYKVSDDTAVTAIATTTEIVTTQVAYSDSTKDDFSFTPSLNSSLASTRKTVTVTYGGKTTTIPITVADVEDTVKSISVQVKPTISYANGDFFDPEGLILKVSYNSGNDSYIQYQEAYNAEDFTFEPSLATALVSSDTVVTITYGGVSVAQPITVSRQISGSVYTSEGAWASGVSVTLSQQGEIMYTAITNDLGVFLFYDVPSGYYDLTASTEKKSVTNAVIIADSTYYFNKVTLPSLNINTSFSTVDDSPVMLVGGLDVVANYYDNLIEDEDDVLTVSLYAGNTSDEESMAYIEIYKEEYEEIAFFFDLDLKATLVGADETTSYTLNNARTLVTVVLDIPFEFRYEEEYAIYRRHGTDVHKLTTTPNEDGECIQMMNNNTEIYLFTQYFSTFALVTGETEEVYQEEEPEEEDYDETTAYTISIQRLVDGSSSTGFLGGVITMSENYPLFSEVVTLSVYPRSGYSVVNIEVQQVDGTFLPVEDLGDNEYDFQQKKQDVTVYVYFASNVSGSLATKSNFIDVSITDWYCSAINEVSNLGIMNGTGDGKFSPKVATTRAMMVAILYQMAGSPKVSELSTFTDVGENAYFAKAVAWAEDVGVVTGYADGSFKPHKAVTRQELAIIFHSYYQNVTGGTEYIWLFPVEYSDQSTIANWAKDAVLWCSNMGLFTGKVGNRFSPRETALRGELAVSLLAFLEGTQR